MNPTVKLVLSAIVGALVALAANYGLMPDYQGELAACNSALVTCTADLATCQSAPAPECPACPECPTVPAATE